MKKLSFKSFLAMFAFLVFFSACQQDENDAVTPTNPQATTNSLNIMTTNEGNRSSTSNTDSDSTSYDDCFQIVFPITINYPDGSSEAVNSEEELDQKMIAWFEANMDAEDFPTIAFPINVTVNGEAQQVANDEALCDLLHECYGDDDWEGEPGDDDWDDIDVDVYVCYELVYPVTVQAEDGTQTTIDSEDEFETFVMDLFENIDTTQAEPEFPDFDFVYPITVTQNEETITVNSEEELEALEEACGCPEIGDIGEHGDCLEIQFPIQLQNPDGTTESVDSEEALYAFLDAYFEANPNAEEGPELVYPITVAEEDGTTHTVANEDAFEALLVEKCFGDDDDNG